MNRVVISHKYKLLLLLICMSVLMLTVYNLSIKKSLNIINENIQLQNKLEYAHQAPQKILSLEHQLDNWNSRLITSINTQELQVQLFNEVSTICKARNVELVGMQKVCSKNEKDIGIETFEVSLISDYKTLVSTINYMEEGLVYGKISSLNFELRKNRKKKRDDLVLTVFIQSAVKSNGG